MRNCFTKITNIFRKSALPHSSDHDYDSEMGNLQQSGGEAQSSMEPTTTSEEQKSKGTQTPPYVRSTSSISLSENHKPAIGHNGVDSADNESIHQLVIKNRDSFHDKHEKVSYITKQTISIGDAVDDRHRLFQSLFKKRRRTMKEAGNSGNGHSCRQDQIGARLLPTVDHQFSRGKHMYHLSDAGEDQERSELKQAYGETRKLLLTSNPFSILEENEEGSYSAKAKFVKNDKYVEYCVGENNNDKVHDISLMLEKGTNSFVSNDVDSSNALIFPSNNPDSCTDSPNAAKTPEEIEYEAKVAAESEDMMTPLPTNTKHHPFALGRNLRPEIAEVIRSLDANTLRINNLTVEDKLELLRRFESTQHARRSGRGNSHVRSMPPAGHSIQIDLGLAQTRDQHTDDLSDLSTDGVILRRKNSHTSQSNLYERRQPKSPKLKLILESKWKEGTFGGASDATICEYKRNVCDVKYPTVLPPNPQLKALLVFYKSDNICEVVQQACNRQQLEVTLVKSKENAIENLCSAVECFHIIIIDARSPKHLDAEHIARSIRHMSGHHFTTIIAVVKKSTFDRDDVINALLDAGVNRCIAETTSLSMCAMEIKQILHSIVRPHNVISTQQALYTALHRLKEVLLITDDLLRIQYANRSAERLLNMRLDEVINKPLSEIFVSDVSTINNSVQGKGVREFDGILTVKRKNQDGIPMHVRVVPVACIGRTTTHFVYNFDVPGGQMDFVATLPQPKEAPRGSLHSIRRGSFDVRSIASDGLRRTSLAKLTSLPLEAPITKIINLLSQVQENCSADEARLIDKVMEFLKREGLYSPQMKEIRTDDPIATDLIGALLTGPNVYSSRRSSNDSIVRANCTNRQSTVMPAKMKATPLIMEILEESLNWEFNIFKLEEVTERHPLLYLGMEIFRRFDVFATLNVDESICKNWLAIIERNYHADNSYHNSTHAADVMQATGVFISQLAAKDLVMDRLEEASALIAAAAHDVDHPGRSSAFLCNSNSPLAILYNDLTVLESHHASTTFKLTLGDDNANIFKNLDTETYKAARTTIIDMILATEMTRHFEHLAKFVSVFGAELEPRDIVQSEEESSVLMRRMLIKVADVSNPARPMICCIEWSRRIAEEYFTQTDEEKSKNLPIVMPMFDRGTCSIPKSQIGFIEYIIQDMMHAWDSFIDMPELITYMQINYSQWKKFEEQGVHTLAEVKAKQMSLMNKKSALK
ncbi:high affinity cAMP-specific and IBMX-insensitive 3',5'-cyclic phosphodiesterase 8 [Stomoxys calcitrans]|uniref:high affinity cAMP-specific and IBMX-insensitive 3',5'-cyclic phosphodiesterase 8 n=1 Tax=Stomoxys calcitrans TaxID=35570 RepID=UPI0027E378B6|nr:high affinity cAMP-specific and IBMX-insensitive 3',5'-cyclic phosphodiesterase 8 [Stomoxys calcitrans]